jgi:hypothetical protein
MWFIAIGEEHMITLPCPPIFTCSQYQHAASSATAFSTVHTAHSATAFSTVHTARSIRCDGIGAAPGSRWQVPAASRRLPGQPGLAAGASLSCSARACTVLQSAQQYELFSLHGAQQCELLACTVLRHYRGAVLPVGIIAVKYLQSPIVLSKGSLMKLTRLSPTCGSADLPSDVFAFL